MIIGGWFAILRRFNLLGPGSRISYSRKPWCCSPKIPRTGGRRLPIKSPESRRRMWKSTTTRWFKMYWRSIRAGSSCPVTPMTTRSGLSPSRVRARSRLALRNQNTETSRERKALPGPKKNTGIHIYIYTYVFSGFGLFYLWVFTQVYDYMMGMYVFICKYQIYWWFDCFLLYGFFCFSCFFLLIYF